MRPAQLLALKIASGTDKLMAKVHDKLEQIRKLRALGVLKAPPQPTPQVAPPGMRFFRAGVEHHTGRPPSGHGTAGFSTGD